MTGLLVVAGGLAAVTAVVVAAPALERWRNRRDSRQRVIRVQLEGPRRRS